MIAEPAGAPPSARRRRAATAALEAAGFSLALVNGGGSGSLAATSHDGSVTEMVVDVVGNGRLFPLPHIQIPGSWLTWGKHQQHLL